MNSSSDHCVSVERAFGIDQIRPEEWDACVTDGNPFVRHAYLTAIEAYGVAVAENGYVPRHLLLRNRSGQLVAAAPLYLKSHSDAEIGSDFGWSLAHERAVGPYYPKLQVESPVTPTPGPRLLVRPGPGEQDSRAALVDALRAEVVATDVSSLHANFLKPEDWRCLQAHGFLCDIGVRFAWFNPGYANFDSFLADLKGRRRGMIRRERREFSGTRLTFERLEGDDITPRFIDDFVPLYASTYEKYGTPTPLTTGTFHHLRETSAQHMMFTTARLDGDLVAAVMFMHGGDTLYALHWGGRINQRFLHYELTYYQGIEFAIEHGFANFDAGPGGVHKPPRGLSAVPSLNAHWFRSAEFARLLANGIDRRIKTVLAQMVELDRISAFKPGLGRSEGVEGIHAAL